MGRLRYLCDECRRRNAEAGAVRKAERERELAGVVKRFTDWLHHAPQMARFPDPVGSFDDGPQRAFVEVVDLAMVADQLARDFLHYNAWLKLHHDHLKCPPAAYQGVVRCVIHSKHYRQDWTEWTGSVYGLSDDRIALHWHTWEKFYDD